MKGSYDAKEALREKLKRDMEAWEAKNGKVETTPIIRRITDNLGDVFVSDRQRCHHRANSKRISERSERVIEAKRLFKKGLNRAQIAKELGVTKWTVTQYLRDFKKTYGY